MSGQKSWAWMTGKTSTTHSINSLHSEFFSERVDITHKTLIFFEKCLKFFAWIHNCWMLSSIKNISNSLVRIAEFIFEEVHSNLTWYHEVSRSTIPKNWVSINTKVIADSFDDFFVRDRAKYVFDTILFLSYVWMFDIEICETRWYRFDGW